MGTSNAGGHLQPTESDNTALGIRANDTTGRLVGQITCPGPAKLLQIPNPSPWQSTRAPTQSPGNSIIRLYLLQSSFPFSPGPRHPLLLQTGWWARSCYFPCHLPPPCTQVQGSTSPSELTQEQCVSERSIGNPCSTKSYKNASYFPLACFTVLRKHINYFSNVRAALGRCGISSGS